MTDLVRTDVPSDFARQMEMAKVYATSSLLPAHLRGKPENVLIILAGARSLNVSAFWALQSMHVIDGKLSLAAELMRGLAIRAGHQVRVVKRTADEAVVEIKRGDRDTAYQASFTWEEAKTAGLADKSNWKKFRAAMLVARATSIAMRDECPDVLYGVVYTPDELGAVENEDGSLDAMPAEEVPAMSDQELATLLAKIAGANSTDLFAFAKESASRGVLDRQTGGGGVKTEIVNRIKILADTEGVTEADIRNLYKVASGIGALDDQVTLIREPGAEPEIVAFRDALKIKTEMIQAEAARLAEPDVEDAEVVEDETNPEINTPHAQQLREEAANSWDDDGTSSQS
jgi:hypothetical protein